jgi:transposase-like protein
MRRDLDRQMATVLLRFEMVSNGSCQAWNPSGGHSGEPDDKVVLLMLRHDEPPHLRWKRIYSRATSALQCVQIIESATQELEAWTRRVAPKVENTKSLVDLILEDGKGHEPDVVARRFGVDAAYVRRLRARAGIGIEDGRKIDLNGNGDRPAKARQLRARGMSTRQIATILDAHQTQVMRWIRQESESSGGAV